MSHPLDGPPGERRRAHDGHLRRHRSLPRTTRGMSHSNNTFNFFAFLKTIVLGPCHTQYFLNTIFQYLA